MLYVRYWLMTGRFGSVVGRMVGMLLKALPQDSRAEVVGKSIRVCIDGSPPEKKVRFLLELDNRLYQLQGRASVEYGGGFHTKHRHTCYHKFFIENVRRGESVLDVGCGNGLLSKKIAEGVPDTRVLGLDVDESNIEFARAHHQRPNLTFILGDATKGLPSQRFDVIILSNILEHLDDRKAFLEALVREQKPKRLILRVPCLERDWRVPLKKELGIDYRLDKTHRIEYTQEEFRDELEGAGLKPKSMQSRWGEIWCVAEP